MNVSQGVAKEKRTHGSRHDQGNSEMQTSSTNQGQIQQTTQGRKVHTMLIHTSSNHQEVLAKSILRSTRAV
eukprot:616256-Ditylum_brightwellii.AAC.1